MTYMNINQSKRLTQEPSTLTVDKGFVYLVCNPVSGAHKIGFSTNVSKRLEGLRTVSPECILVFHRPASPNFERYLHEHFSHNRIAREWFRLDAGDIEWIVSDKAWNTYIGDPSRKVAEENFRPFRTPKPKEPKPDPKRPGRQFLRTKAQTVNDLTEDEKIILFIYHLKLTVKEVFQFYVQNHNPSAHNPK